jgi:hypothetical protein
LPVALAFWLFMRTYLRTFNPLIALLVFVLCSFAAMKEDKDKPIVIGNVVAGGIPTYFFAKGMFCGVALILLGKILENQLRRDDREHSKVNRKQSQESLRL